VSDPQPAEAPRRYGDKRGVGADWQDPWPVVGVRRGAPAPSGGADALRAEGYRAVFDVETIEADRDTYQDHLNNTAAVRIFNELRVAYVASHLAPDWPRFLRRGALSVVVRELHVQYDSEGWMHERYVGAMRVALRRGKAALVEQHLVEATTGRSLARAWIVQLLVGGEGVVAWPDLYWDLAATVEGGPIPSDDDGARHPWGPPR